jgi:hypothetical protein
MTAEPTISSILLELANEYTGIVAERDVFERVLTRRPSRAKDPYASIRNLLRYDSLETGWVRLGGGKLIPRRVALQDLRFRVLPSAEEIASDVLARAKLEPFVQLRMANPQLLDAQGQPIASATTRLPGSTGIFNFAAVDAQTLNGWYRQHDFRPGDSILITITATAPITLQLEYEPAAHFRANDTAAQDHELLEGIVEQISRNRSTLLLADMLVLPIFAQAPWRTRYPGRPWQTLVAGDRRLRLLDDMYIADRSFRRPLDFLGESEVEEVWEQADQELLDAIAAFQAELRASRCEAAERGVWDGIAPRASTGQIVFDIRAGTSHVIQPEAVNTLLDHSEEIEQRVARGDFAAIELDADDDDELNDMELLPELEGADALFEIEDIEDMQQFMLDNPALVEATKKLMASLSPAEMAALNDAETPDQVQSILTKHLNTLLGRAPELFAELTPELTPTSNGHDLTYDPDLPDSAESGYSTSELLALDGSERWEDDNTGDDWMNPDDEDEGEDEEATNEAAERSNALMERFYLAQLEQGKSETTAASRTGDLWIYADFLSSYYSRSLNEGDYATLDECLFFYYPRKVLNNSARSARDMCTSFKQFYTFLRAEGVIADDTFAQAMWRRRDQAARVVELYDEIDGESPQFERLFAHLFAPYTA